MTPQTTTASPFSKKRNWRPPCSLSFTRQPLISGRTSLSIAATSATLDISVRPKPIYRPSQCVLHRNDLPSEFALRLRGTGKHHLRSHAHRVDRGSRFLLQHSAGNDFVDHSSGKREDVRQLYSGR